ncbi:MAG: hypothetical protein GY906_23700 [bacterium]|nr:hypothetical protein [bacterium]
MRAIALTLLVTGALIVGCGSEAEKAPEAAAADPLQGVAGGMLGLDEQPASINLVDEVRSAWAAVKLSVVDRESGEVREYLVEVGERQDLKDTGLTVEVVAFVPDFVMDEGGISSHSEEPNNPAVKVLVQEEGKIDYTGWLFGAMPEIHPFPHERFQLLLVEGVPAE